MADIVDSEKYLNTDRTEETEQECLPIHRAIIEEAILDESDLSDEDVKDDINEKESVDEQESSDINDSSETLPIQEYTNKNISMHEENKNSSPVVEHDSQNSSLSHEDGTKSISSLCENEYASPVLESEIKSLSPIHEIEHVAPIPEETELSPVTENESPVPEEAGDVSPVPEETEEVSLVPEATEDVSPVPNETEDVSPVPEGTEQYSPVPEETGHNSPVPEEIEHVSPVPEETEHVSPVPNDTETLAIPKDKLINSDEEISSVLPEKEVTEDKTSSAKSSICDSPNKSPISDKSSSETEPNMELSNADELCNKPDSLEIQNKHKALIHEEMLTLSDEEEDSSSRFKTEQTDFESPSIPIKEGTVENFTNNIFSGAETSDVPIKMEVDTPNLQVAKINSLNVKSKKTKKKPEANSAKKRISRSIIVGDQDVPDGWQRLAVQRQVGASAGKFDVYYISPLGKKLRSRNDVTSYCEKNNIEIDITKFKFTYGPSRSPGSLSTTNVVKSDGITKKRKILLVDKEKSTESSVPTKRIKLSPIFMKKTNTSVSPTNEAKIVPKTEQKDISHFKASIKLPTRLKLKGKNSWIPPKSPFNLYQEALHHDPWKLLIGTIFLNKTSGDDALGRNILCEFLERWPTPENLLAAEEDDIVDVIKPLGLHEKRVKLLFQFSEEYLNKAWTYPKELHGIGKYGNDCYRIFCVNEWRKVKPTDYLLTFYIEWLWDNHKFLGLD